MMVMQHTAEQLGVLWASKVHPKTRRVTLGTFAALLSPKVVSGPQASAHLASARARSEPSAGQPGVGRSSRHPQGLRPGYADPVNDGMASRATARTRATI